MTFSSILASSSNTSSALAARRKYQTAGAMASSRTFRLMTTTRISTRRTTPSFVQSSYQTLEQTLSKIKDLPPSERPEALRMAEQPVKSLLNEMKENNTISKWNSLGKIQSENVFPRAFTEVGLTDVDAKIGTPNNDAQGVSSKPAPDKASPSSRGTPLNRSFAQIIPTDYVKRPWT